VPCGRDVGMMERAIVLQLLGDRRWTRAELMQATGIDGIALRAILATLVVEGVAVLDRDAVVASRCARYLDKIGLVAV
jgi:hypothetical protein